MPNIAPIPQFPRSRTIERERPRLAKKKMLDIIIPRSSCNDHQNYGDGG
jgi:hypothetical protein